MNEADLKAKELASGLSQKQRYQAITDYINHSFVYDYIKSLTVRRYGVKPDPDGCWEKRMGICGDLAALAAHMLRAAGLRARAVAGRADGKYHAWVESAYGIYDPTAEITRQTVKTYRKERVL